MNKFFKAIILVFSLPATCGFIAIKNTGSNFALLIALHDQQAASTKLQHLFAYHFVSGNPQAGEKIVTVKTQSEKEKNASYIRFDLGENKMYRNRYIITGIGNIIDVKNKKILLDQKDQFIKCAGDSVVFYTNDIFRGKFYSYFNLKTEQYNRINDLLYKAIPGKDIEVDQSTNNFKIWLYPPSASKVLLVKDAGYGEDATLLTDKKSARTPYMWIDNSNFIYPNYSQQHNFATIYKVNADTKLAEMLGSIEDIPSVSFNSYFTKDNLGNILYVCGKGQFVVDAKKKKVTAQNFIDVGNGFFISSADNPTYGRIIKYNDVEIGKYFCDPKNVKSAPGVLAFCYDMVVNGERYPQGVTYYALNAKKWKEIPITEGDVASVIGFIEE
jgi:hypothetical protein